MPAGSVHCCVTSPPYFRQRDYRLPATAWGDGWVGCLGMEATADQFVAHLVEVFAEVRRVWRDDGSLWLNLDDRYVAKRLLGVPWRAALALQDEGWWLRIELNPEYVALAERRLSSSKRASSSARLCESSLKPTGGRRVPRDLAAEARERRTVRRPRASRP